MNGLTNVALLIYFYIPLLTATCYFTRVAFSFGYMQRHSVILALSIQKELLRLYTAAWLLLFIARMIYFSHKWSFTLFNGVIHTHLASSS